MPADKYLKLAREFYTEFKREVDDRNAVRRVIGFPCLGSSMSSVEKLAALLETVAVDATFEKDEHGHWKGCTQPMDHAGECIVLVKRAR